MYTEAINEKKKARVWQKYSIHKNNIKTTFIILLYICKMSLKKIPEFIKNDYTCFRRLPLSQKSEILIIGNTHTKKNTSL